MKKTSILIGMFVIAAGNSITMANGIKVDFDSPGTNGSITELIGKIAEADYAGKSAIPEPVAFTKGVVGGADHYQDKLILAKDLLTDITPEMRVKFISVMQFGNGIGSYGRAILASAGLPETRILGIESALQTAPDIKNSGTSSAKSLKNLLHGVPADLKKDFADGLKFLNGNVVSAKTGMLNDSVFPETLEEIINTIMPTPKDARENRAILKDHSCWASTGAKDRAVLRGCSYDPGYTCNTATCK